jgi:CBS domain-containing protein
MTTVAEIMSTDVRTIAPQENLREAARLMRTLDVGALPVCQEGRLLGMLTDRDIAVRGVADGLAPERTAVSDIMSGDVECATEDEDAEDAMRRMGDRQLRRLPVVDEDRIIVGIVSLADVALRHDGHIDETVREISEPGGPSSQSTQG